MRTTVGALLLILGLTVSASAQSPLRVNITDGESSAGMQPVTMPYATGGPWAAVPSRPLTPDVTPTVTDFRIRTWVEGDGARVIVFAVTRKPDSTLNSDDERETQIASVALKDGQSLVIAATETYNARRVTLTASTLDFRAEIHEPKDEAFAFAPILRWARLTAAPL
jgi:hypothetical protein